MAQNLRICASKASHLKAVASDKNYYFFFFFSRGERQRGQATHIVPKGEPGASGLTAGQLVGLRDGALDAN